jgi:hypothetical protein
MADQIPGAALLIQPAVSHFSFLQDPKQFNDNVLHFLEHAKNSDGEVVVAVDALLDPVRQATVPGFTAPARKEPDRR